jgi:SagB-type dehydrogenase family enzyme
VVFNLTARFQRLSWKYSSIAYTLMLKDVGGLYQTMYLVAEAMGLAPCALGAGHADWLCRAAGLNYLEESPVGEFLLGSRQV